MKKIIFSIVFITSFYSIAKAQLGVSIEYYPEQFELLRENENVLEKSRNAVLTSATTYFRLKNYRLEFIPYIGYYRGFNTETIENSAIESYSNGLAIGSKVLAYPFDFQNDCDCPTFNKSGMWLKKGFFFFVDPQFLTYNLNYENVSNTLNATINHTAGKYSLVNLSVGVGIDFGLSEGITLTPYAGFHTNLYWNENTALVRQNLDGTGNWEDTTLSFSNPSFNPPLTFGLLLQYRLSKRRY